VSASEPQRNEPFPSPGPGLRDELSRVVERVAALAPTASTRRRGGCQYTVSAVIIPACLIRRRVEK